MISLAAHPQRSTAVHESGHCCGLLFFGCAVARVELCAGTGRTIGYDPAAGLRGWRRGDPAILSLDRLARAEISAIVALAGAVAQRTGLEIAGEDGVVFRHAIAIFPPAAQRQAIARAERRTRALLGSRPGQEFVTRLADRLVRDRHLGNATCRTLFREVFGGLPSLTSWLACWPPSLQELAEGRWLPATRALYPGWHKNPACVIRKAA